MELLDRDQTGSVDDDDAVFQTATLEALLDGAYEGDLTVGELLAHGDLGIGTVDHLDGEMVIVDGDAFVIRSSGRVDSVPAETGTPFAVVAHHGSGPSIRIGPCSTMTALTASIDVVAGDAPVVAVRVDGRFDSLRVRSVARQEPPYPPLREVTSHQTEWNLTDVVGSLLGFRFPDVTGGLEVPGWHLHFLSDDRSAGGHVIEAALRAGDLRVEPTDDLHVEVPASIGVVAFGADRATEIAEAEGGRWPDQ